MEAQLDKLSRKSLLLAIYLKELKPELFLEKRYAESFVPETKDLVVLAQQFFGCVIEQKACC